MAIIAFDVDGTLISFKDKPKDDIVQLLKILHNLGNRIIVWSGGGKNYAELWVKRLFLDDFVDEVKDKFDNETPIDICFDDELVALAAVNIKVER